MAEKIVNVAVIMSTTGRNIGWLKQAIESVRKNETENLRISIYLHFDGCSPCSTDADFVLASMVSVGLGDSMNKCLMNILKSDKKYDFIARMDDDDLISSDKFKKQVELMESNPKVDFCSTLAQIMDENGKITDASWSYASDNGKSIRQRFLDGGCHIVHAATMFRASMLYDKGHLWYNPLLRQVEDYDLWFRILRLGYSYSLLPEHLYYYRVHSRQETRNNNEDKNKMCAEIHNFYKQAWGKFLC